MTTHLTTTDYMSIAKLVAANCLDESKTIEIEYSIDRCVLFVTIQHDIKCVEGVGGSYEGYDFETISELVGESVEVLEVACYDDEGEAVEHNFKNEILTKLIN